MKLVKALVVCLLTCGSLTAGPITIIVDPPKQILVPQPPKNEYVSALAKMDQAIVEIADVKKYVKIEVEIEGKKVAFKQLGEFQQNMILLVQIHRLSNELRDLRVKWLVCQKTAKLLKLKNAPSETAIKDFLKKLEIIRKKHAKNHQEFAKQVMLKFKDRIPETDAKYYLSQVKKDQIR